LEIEKLRILYQAKLEEDEVLARAQTVTQESSSEPLESVNPQSTTQALTK
jgi:hypothetical protein